MLLGNSMLERFKSTGAAARLRNLESAWNAGCGGDKNENVLYRLEQGLYGMLKVAQQTADGKCNIKLWILASGTNNLHPKRAFRASDVESWKLLVEACLRIAPKSRVVACDVLYRQDIPDGIVDASNQSLKECLDGINDERVTWVGARHMISKEMLVDKVHLNEEGYEVWDGVLWPHVARVLALENGGQDV